MALAKEKLVLLTGAIGFLALRCLLAFVLVKSDWRLLLGFGLCSIIAVSIAKIERHCGLSYELPKRMMISDVVLGAIVMTLVIRAEKGPKATSKFKEVMSEYFRKESAS